MMMKKEFELYDDQSAQDEIYKIRKTARSLEKLVKTLKKYVPNYQPKISELSATLLSPNAIGKFTDFVFNADWANPSLNKTDGLDRGEVYNSISAAVSGISRPDKWDYWYNVTADGRVNIRAGYTGELKSRYRFKPSRALGKAFDQAKELAELMNRSGELTDVSGPMRLAGIRIIRVGKTYTYQRDDQFFIELFKRGA